MFTGIIQAIGRIEKVDKRAEDVRLHISLANMQGDVNSGDSIAVNGVCLTAVTKPAPQLIVDVSLESIKRTCIADWKPGFGVNLERALTLSTPLGGHLVSGHVDGIAEFVAREAEGRSQKMIFSLPVVLAKYVAVKGSITIDGVSLTINRLRDENIGSAQGHCNLEVNIVPHTQQHTIMGDYRPGRQVHIEVDLLARYLERLLHFEAPAGKPGIDMALLQRSGFGA